MKKSLVLAMALAMGVTASAYAANPFSDVPAGHWAYGSIAKLVAAGVVDGYPDGTFQGDKLMTRYEMAQIVAKAMAKGANVDRLASEFADELDALGVRVAKLEKKSDNVRITGQVRARYYNTTYDKRDGSEGTHDYKSDLRSRLYLTGEVNDTWNYVNLLENTHKFAGPDFNVTKAGTGLASEDNEGTAWQRSYLDGRLGGTKVQAGRFGLFLADGNVYDTRFDGINVTYGKKVRVGAYYGRPTNENDYYYSTSKDATYSYKTSAVKYDKAWGVNAAADIAKNVTLSAGYDKFTNPYSTDTTTLKGSNLVYTSSSKSDYDDNGIWNVGLAYNTDKWGASFIYMKSNIDDAMVVDGAAKGGFVLTANLMGAKASKPGSYGFTAKWYNQGAGTFPAHTMDGDASYFNIGQMEGFKGYSLVAAYTVAKNMVADVEWYDLKGRETDQRAKTLWTQLMVTF